MTIITYLVGTGVAPAAAAETSAVSIHAAVANTVPLVTKVAILQPSCGASVPRLVVRTATDLNLGYAKSRTGPVFWLQKFGDVPAGTYTVALPALSRGASASWYLAVQVLEAQPKFFGPYRVHRPSSTDCLVRIIAPTRTVLNPRAWVHLQHSASIGITRSRAGAISWVRSEKPAGTYLIKFPAMSRGATAQWYVVLSFLDDTAKKLYLGPLVFTRE